MAVCPFCQGEMSDGISCSTDPLTIAGKVYEPLPWGRERPYRSPPATSECDDCSTPPGGIHHHGCDREECPVCHRQAIGCGCHEPGEWDHSRPRAQPRCADHSGRSPRWPRATGRSFGRPAGRDHHFP